MTEWINFKDEMTKITENEPEFDYRKDLKQYKTASDVYKKYPGLAALDSSAIVLLGITAHKASDYDFAGACRALMILDKEKFKL